MQTPVLFFKGEYGKNKIVGHQVVGSGDDLEGVKVTEALLVVMQDLDLGTLDKLCDTGEKEYEKIINKTMDKGATSKQN